MYSRRPLSARQSVPPVPEAAPPTPERRQAEDSSAMTSTISRDRIRVPTFFFIFSFLPLWVHPGGVQKKRQRPQPSIPIAADVFLQTDRLLPGSYLQSAFCRSSDSMSFRSPSGERGLRAASCLPSCPVTDFYRRIAVLGHIQRRFPSGFSTRFPCPSLRSTPPQGHKKYAVLTHMQLFCPRETTRCNEYTGFILQMQVIRYDLWHFVVMPHFFQAPN